MYKPYYYSMLFHVAHILLQDTSEYYYLFEIHFVNELLVKIGLR